MIKNPNKLIYSGKKRFVLQQEFYYTYYVPTVFDLRKEIFLSYEMVREIGILRT